MPNPIKKSRRQYAPQFKFDRALEALRSDNMSEISRKYGISVNVLSSWRSQLLAHGPKSFEASPDSEVSGLKSKIAKLEQMIGKKEVELNVLKNFSDFYESRNTP
jgi:transposase-like protein